MLIYPGVMPILGMLRPNALVGNGKLMVILDAYGNLLHLYYPHVGMWQHLEQFRLGVQRGSSFRWAPPYSSEDIQHIQSYVDESGVVNTKLEMVGVNLEFYDVIHPALDVFIRRVRVKPASGSPVKLYFYHRLNIAETQYSETVFYDPDVSGLIHFKNNYFFMFGSLPHFSSYACGEHSVKGLSGTYVDAEDGALYKSDVSHGSVDSVAELTFNPEADWSEAYYYILAGRSLEQIYSLNDYLASKDLTKAMEEASSYWSSWFAHKPSVEPKLDGLLGNVYRSSLYVLSSCVDIDGSIIASPDAANLKLSGDSYNYCWWRDAAYVSVALNESGMSQLTLRFLRFAQRNQTKEGYFYHRHRPDGSWGSTWHRKPFVQLDQTCSILYALYNYYLHTHDVSTLLELWPMVKSAATYVSSQVKDGSLAPSYDLWEEDYGVHVYTACTVWQGLLAAEKIGDVLGKERRGWSQTAGAVRSKLLGSIGDGSPPRMLDREDKRADSSMLMLVNTGLIDPSTELARKLVVHVETKLAKKGGGVARYQGDSYWGHENPWIISTLWLAQAKLLLNDRDSALQLIMWVASKSTPTGLLPEQVDADGGRPVSVVPLAWSHATYVTVVNQYLGKGKSGYLMV
ncbi:MAG: glycoside hydrolase family 15 protein [Thermoprotei archaeon]